MLVEEPGRLLKRKRKRSNAVMAALSLLMAKRKDEKGNSLTRHYRSLGIYQMMRGFEFRFTVYYSIL